MEYVRWRLSETVRPSADSVFLSAWSAAAGDVDGGTFPAFALRSSCKASSSSNKNSCDIYCPQSLYEKIDIGDYATCASCCSCPEKIGFVALTQRFRDCGVTARNRPSHIWYIRCATSSATAPRYPSRLSRLTSSLVDHMSLSQFCNAFIEPLPVTPRYHIGREERGVQQALEGGIHEARVSHVVQPAQTGHDHSQPSGDLPRVLLLGRRSQPRPVAAPAQPASERMEQQPTDHCNGAQESSLVGPAGGGTAAVVTLGVAIHPGAGRSRMLCVPTICRSKAISQSSSKSKNIDQPSRGRNVPALEPPHPRMVVSFARRLLEGGFRSLISASESNFKSGGTLETSNATANMGAEASPINS